MFKRELRAGKPLRMEAMGVPFFMMD